LLNLGTVEVIEGTGSSSKTLGKL